MTETVSEPIAQQPAEPVDLPAAQAVDTATEATVETAADTTPAPKPKNKQPRAGKAAFDVLERLFQLYPKMFGARFLPLKLGVFQDILALHPDEFKKEDLKTALGLHARSTRYLEAVASGHKRHDLNAVPVEDVAPEHVHHAIMEVFRRRQARSKEDLRPWVRSRLVQAIESSGLAREEYLERVNAKDDLSIALLDEAFGELAGHAAKREALRRAYEGSGKSIEEFAEMYGMDIKTVRAALANPRR